MIEINVNSIEDLKNIGVVSIQNFITWVILNTDGMENKTLIELLSDDNLIKGYNESVKEFK